MLTSNFCECDALLCVLSFCVYMSCVHTHMCVCVCVCVCECVCEREREIIVCVCVCVCVCVFTCRGRGESIATLGEAMQDWDLNFCIQLLTQ